MNRSALAAELAEAEIVQTLTAMRDDLAAGVVPAGVRRALFAHEVEARTSFAGIEDDISAEAVTLTARLGESRSRFIQLVMAELRRLVLVASPLSPIQRIAQVIFDADGPDGLRAIPGAEGLLEEDSRWHRGRLQVAADRGFRRILAEAAAQSVPVDLAAVLKLDADQIDHLDLMARRLAQAPHGDVIRALREQVLIEPRAFVAPSEVIDRLEGHARGLSDKPLAQYAGDASAHAHGLGRIAGGIEVPDARAWYASEILDRRTCGPCSLVDGHRYESMADARADYPHGVHRRCEGGPRCRGTIVIVWATEAPPSLQTPGD